MTVQPTPSAGAAVNRVGIIGAGAAARLHLQAVHRIGGLRVVGIRDIDVERAIALAAEFNLPPQVADPARFYDARPDSVHITAPPVVHQALALEALQHGAHVLVEKPPALTLNGCETLLAEAARRGLLIAMNENIAADPLIRRARAMLDEGRLGRLLQIDGFYSLGMRQSELQPAWAEPLPGGMLEDLLPHLLAAARTLAGARLVPEYWQFATSGMIAEQEELRLLLRAGHVIVSLALSLTARPKAFVLGIRGTDGTLAIDLRNMLLHLTRPEASGGAIAMGAGLIRSSLGTIWQTVRNAAGIMTHRREPPGSFAHSVRAHYAALRAGSEPPTPFRQSVEKMAIIRQIWPLAEGSGPPPQRSDGPASKIEALTSPD